MKNKLIFVLAIVFVVLFAVSAEQISAAFRFVVMWSSTTTPTINQSFTVTVAANDPIGVWEVYLLHSWWDGSKWANSGWKNQLCNRNVDCERSYTVTNTTVFDEYYQAGAYNIQGVWQSAAQSPLKIRAADPPAASQISSDKGSIVLGDFLTITVSAQDNERGVDFVSFWDPEIGSWERQYCSSARSCAKIWLFRPLSAGIKNYYGGAADFSSWDWASPKPLSVTVTQPDTTFPTGSITASPSSVVSGQPITVTMSGSDNVGVDRFFWNEGNQTHSCGGTATCTKSWSYTILTPGTYTVSGRVYDTANNSVPVTSNTVTVTSPDSTRPKVTFLSAVSPIQPNTDTLITFTVTDSGGSHLNRVEIFRAPFHSENCPTGNEVSLPSGCAWTVERTELAPTGVDSWGPTSYFGSILSSGTWWYGMYVFDNAGNFGTASTDPWVGPKKVVVDGLPPKVVISAPPAGSWQNGNFNVTYEASDAGDGLGMFQCRVLTNTDSIFGFPESSWVDRGVISCTAFNQTAAVTISVTSPINGSFWCTTTGTNACRVRIKAQDMASNRSQDERSFSIDVPSSDPGPAVVDGTPKITAFSATSPIRLGESTVIAWTVTDSGGSHLKQVEIYQAPFNPDNCSDTNKTGCSWSLRKTILAPLGLDVWPSSASDPPSGGTWWYGMHVEDNSGNWSTESTPHALASSGRLHRLIVEFLGWIKSASASHVGGPKKVLVITNTPPSVSQLSVSQGDYCTVPSHVFSWTFSDSEDGSTQTSYHLQADNNSDFSSPELSVSGGSATAYTVVVAVNPGANQLAYNTSYNWRVKVFDSKGADSGWVLPNPLQSPFGTKLHLYPDPNFTFTPTNPSQGEEIRFTQTAVCYDITNSAISCPAIAANYSWDFDYETPPFTQDAIGQSAATTYSNTAAHTVALDVKDADSNTCRGTRNITPKSPLPKFKETAPSG